MTTMLLLDPHIIDIHYALKYRQRNYCFSLTKQNMFDYNDQACCVFIKIGPTQKTKCFGYLNFVLSG